MCNIIADRWIIFRLKFYMNIKAILIICLIAFSCGPVLSADRAKKQSMPAPKDEVLKIDCSGVTVDQKYEFRYIYEINLRKLELIEYDESGKLYYLIPIKTANEILISGNGPVGNGVFFDSSKDPKGEQPFVVEQYLGVSIDRTNGSYSRGNWPKVQGGLSISESEASNLRMELPPFFGGYPTLQRGQIKGTCKAVSKMF